MKKKFKLTKETKVTLEGVTLFRIECTESFKDIKKGDKGGWIEKESNLSGDAWVYGNAMVYGNALVYGNAMVSGNARVSGYAMVYGNAEVYGYALVYGDAMVYGNAEVYGNAGVSGNARVSGDAEVYGYALVYGDAMVSGNARVSGDAWDKTPPLFHGTKHSISESKKGFLKIGCMELSFSEWKKKYKEIGKKQGYSENEIEEYGIIIMAIEKTSKIK